MSDHVDFDNLTPYEKDLVSFITKRKNNNETELNRLHSIRMFFSPEDMIRTGTEIANRLTVKSEHTAILLRVYELIIQRQKKTKNK